MGPRATTPYRASGGDSELRSYDAGEGLTIESQLGGSYALAWSARVSPSDFLQVVGSLVDASADTELSPPTNGRPSIPLREATAIVQAKPEQFHFIAVDAPSDSFTWEAINPSAKAEEYPELPGEVGIAFSALNRTWVRQLITATATRHVCEDIEDILASAERLTAPSTPASA
jgi:hypothetical protein